MASARATNRICYGPHARKVLIPMIFSGKHFGFAEGQSAATWQIRSRMAPSQSASVVQETAPIALAPACRQHTGVARGQSSGPSQSTE